MADYTSFFDDPVTTALPRAVGGVETSADTAGKVIQLSKKGNVAPQLVEPDPDAFSVDLNRSRAAKAVQDNPQIAKYVANNEMAGKVSSDDYDNLDRVSSWMKKLGLEEQDRAARTQTIRNIPEVYTLLQSPAGRQRLMQSFQEYEVGTGTAIVRETLGAVAGVVEGFTPRPDRKPDRHKLDYYEAQEEFKKDLYRVGGGILSIAGIPLAGFTGAAKGIAGPPLAIATGLPLRDTEEAVSTALMGAAAKGGLKPTAAAPGYTSVDDFLRTLRGMKTREEIDAFLRERAARDNPQVLQITKAERAAEDLSGAVQAAQESKTKQRSPETFAEFTNTDNNGTVSIPAGKIADLYSKAGKTPAEGDGLFGFVPDLERQVALGLETGVEVKIPVGTYIAHVDPTVHEGLRDVVRLNDKGVTLEEAKEIKEEQKALEAYHGTPHEFDEFSLSKVGTGEGAQSYGHGLYFAENRKVSEEYRANLAPDGQLILNNGVSVPQANPMDAAKALNLGDERYPFAYALANMTSGASLDEAIATTKVQYEGNPNLDKAIETLRKYEPQFKPGTGNLYKVRIAAKPEQMLDWDSPVDEKRPEIQALMNKTRADMGVPDVPTTTQEMTFGQWIDVAAIGSIGKGLTGEQLYASLKEFLTTYKKTKPNEKGFYHTDDGREAASRALAEVGIPGIRYLDQGSRFPADAELQKRLQESIVEEEKKLANETDPAEIKYIKERIEGYKETLAQANAPQTRNYVIFDDKLVKIIEKNDNPVVQAVIEATDAVKREYYLSPLFQGGKAVGITENEFKKYSDLIDKANEHILAKAVELAKRDVKKRQSAEWKKNEAETRAEVEVDLKYDPAFMADRYFRTGELPDGTFVPKDMHGPLLDKPDMALSRADDLAPIFGFETGSQLSSAVIALEEARKAAGKGPKWQFKQAVEAETARRMEERYGQLADNIALEASEAALADWHVDILASEVRMLAELAGIEPPLSRQHLTTWAKEQFEGMPATDAMDLERFRTATEKQGRAAEKALLKGDYEAAFKIKQAQMLDFVLARESKNFLKLYDRTNRIIKRVSNEQQIDSMDQVHLDQLRQMLANVGYPNKFPVQGLEPTAQFVGNSEGQIAVTPWMINPALAEFNGPYDMPVADFRNFRKSIDSMMHAARETKLIASVHGKANLDNVVFDINKQQERFNLVEQPLNPSVGQRVASFGRWLQAVHILPERVFDYIDKFDPNGPITTYLDRPLRNANVKEIELIEKVTKHLRALPVDASINEHISNDVIPNPFARNGLMDMTRQNLRILMLNMGEAQRIVKVADGFGVTEGQLWNLIKRNATAADIAWVNGMHKMFAELKIEADAMELRDTGVPADEAEPIETILPNGTMTGGYAPMVYDKTRSNINQVIGSKNPIFDQHYVQATTPKGYTIPLTDYAGAIDLTGALLTSKIRGMVHDIAFREAVRNAAKLLNNEDFMQTMTAKWGAETSGLLNGWLKDIANVHNVDDSYAQGFSYAMSWIRQNVVSSLIALNPSTVIKHGISAMALSSAQVGTTPLLKSAVDIGLKGMAEAARDLIREAKDGPPSEEWLQSLRDVIDPGERGESARQFIMNSSAVMRNRQRKYAESIRGAMDLATSVGPGQTFANIRQASFNIGRMPVAMSDALSAMPTWLAAYKQARLAGEEHADAVFIADKEVSRAHGSSFIGDKPRVSRNTSEIMRWMTPLYNFWNHVQNMYFQMAWDAGAMMQGRQEPGANARSLANRMFLVFLIPLLAEELAVPALDESKDGIGVHTLKLLGRHLGAGIVGLRDFTNAASRGQNPAMGLIGTVATELAKAGADVKRAFESGKKMSDNWIIHAATILGFATGVGGVQPGRTGSFGVDVVTGKERPRGFNQWRQGLRTGHSKARKH